MLCKSLAMSSKSIKHSASNTHSGEGDETGLTESSGDLQHQLMLHVPHCEEARRQPVRARARRGGDGEGDGEGARQVPRWWPEAGGAGGVHWWQAGWVY